MNDATQTEIKALWADLRYIEGKWYEKGADRVFLATAEAQIIARLMELGEDC